LQNIASTNSTVISQEKWRPQHLGPVHRASWRPLVENCRRTRNARVYYCHAL